MDIIKRYKNKDILWEDVENHKIDKFVWDTFGYKPETNFKIVLTEKGIKIRFIATEEEIKIDNVDINSSVYKDSCVEFFFNPNPEGSANYINLEINARGTVLGQIGPNGAQREFLTEEDIKSLNVKADVNAKNIKDFNNFKPWKVEYIVPFELIKKYYPKFKVENFKVLKCNFYKCGDKTKTPHYGSYFEINYHKPSFHRPEFFGEFIID